MNDSRAGTLARPGDKIDTPQVDDKQTAQRLFDDIFRTDLNTIKKVCDFKNQNCDDKLVDFIPPKADFKLASSGVGAELIAFAPPGGIPRGAKPFKPGGYSIIPPYMLQELAQRNPFNSNYIDTLKQTEDLNSSKTGPLPFLPRISPDEKGKREVYDAEGKEELPGTKARFEGEGKSSDEEVNKAYDYTGLIRDYYKQVHNRDSIDGKGMKFVSTVNYGENYENAFWDGNQMTYGRPGADSPFATFVLLDVCGHEITHGVTEKESNLEYYGQSGALNESLSDIFGELVQQRAKGIQAKDADWIVGDGIWKGNVQGTGLRNMLNPGTAYDDPSVGKDPQPAHMKDYVKTRGDNGGVHYNSGIPNRAFALFAIEVGGNAWDQPGQIWYEARKNAGSNPSFAQFAHHTIEAAKTLGHTDLVEKLTKAWDSVGIAPSASAKDTLTPVRLADDPIEDDAKGRRRQEAEAA